MEIAKGKVSNPCKFVLFLFLLFLVEFSLFCVLTCLCVVLWLLQRS